MSPTSPSLLTSRRSWLVGILVVSYGLRIWLNQSGGHFFWPDESRYGSAQNAAYDFSFGQWRRGFVELAGHADHAFFRWASLPAALAEHTGGDDRLIFSSLYFSLFSVGAIALVWAVARRAGASDDEAFWSAFYAAACNSLFLYSRHFLPYDMSLVLMLGGLWVSLGSPGRWTSFLTGVIVGFGFLTYNGYWLLGGSVLVLHTLSGSGGWRRSAARAGFSATGLLLPIALMVGLGALTSGEIFKSYQVFAASVKQGDFGAGYRVIGLYLWHSEGFLLPVLVAAFGAGLAASRGAEAQRRMLLWTAALGIILGGLVCLSDGVHAFMVYGRLARVAVPFLCLGAGLGTARLLEGPSRRRAILGGLVFALVSALAAVNFRAPIQQVFPDGFLKLSARTIYRDTANGYGFYRILNVGQLWGRNLDTPSPNGLELLRRSHPLQYKPNQFEGYSSVQRAALNRNDMAMRLLKFPMHPEESVRWAGFPGPIRLRVTFPVQRWNLAEPIVVSGSIGIGDIFFVRYVDPTHVVFGLDHWGEAVITSEPADVNYTVPHEIVISGGFLLPPPESEAYKDRPELSLMREHLLVVMDGKTVMSRRAKFHPSTPRTIYFGAAIIGGTTTEPNFTGDVFDFGSADLAAIERAIPVVAYPKLVQARSPDWRGCLGPVRMRFALPKFVSGPNEGAPLLSLTGNGFRGVLLLVHEGADKVKVGFDVLGSGALWSEPVPLSGSGVETAEICIGSLLPDPEAAVYGHAPNFVQMRGMVYVRLNGQIALFSPVKFGPVTGQRVVFGANTPGSSAAGGFFQGEVASLETVDLQDIPVGLNALGGPISALARPGWDDYPGPLQMEVSFGSGLAGDSQPILTTGVVGAGDFVFVRYEADGRARICVDHWGRGLLQSEPFSLVPGSWHLLRLSIGSLFPPLSSPLYRSRPDLKAQAQFASVDLDGRRILESRLATHPNRPEWITLGSNFIGGSSVGTAFLGTLNSVKRAPLDGGDQ